jgi:hypothetical protein
MAVNVNKDLELGKNSNFEWKVLAENSRVTSEFSCSSFDEKL